MAGRASPAAVCPPTVLEERIANLLSTQNIAVIATVDRHDAPNATPVRYYPLGFEIMFTASDRSPKVRNLRRDTRVSAGKAASLVGQASSRGAQLYGTARLLPREHPDADGYWEVFRWQSDHAERGRDLGEPPTDLLVVITAHRIVYTEHWLRRDGYAPRQVWTSPESSKTHDNTSVDSAGT